MDKENTGCFAWIVSFKQSCNERWARFRNRLRRRFYARRGQAIDPSTFVNETGTRDMVICKSPYMTKKVIPESIAAPKTTENAIGDYVSCIIKKAADSLWMERQASLGNKNGTVDNSAGNVSLSPSIISLQTSLELLAEKLMTAGLLPGYNC